MVVGPGNLANYKGKTRGRIYSAGNELLFKDNVRMRIILLGPPGSGKSVISRKIADKYGFPVVSVEEVAEELSAMAQQEDELGRLARDAIGSGRVSDDVCNIVLRRVLSRNELDPGFVLVGYPKDVSQAEFMEQALNQIHRPLDLVLMIDIDRDELMERRVGRIDCDACGTHYNLYVNPPLVEGICDLCGARVSRRPRGYEENIANQLREYDVAVQPVLDFYRGLGKLRLVDANGTEDELWEGVQTIIDNTTPVVLEPPEEQREKAETPASPGSAGNKPAEALPVVEGEDMRASASATGKAVKKSPAKKAAVKKKQAVKKSAAKKAVKKAGAKKLAKKKVVKKSVAKKPAKKKVVKKAAAKKTSVKKSAARKKIVKKVAKKAVKKAATQKAVKKKVVKKAATKKKVVKKAAKKVANKTVTKKAAAAKKVAAGKKVAKKKIVKKAASKKKVAKKPVSKKTVKKSAVKKAAGRKKAVKKASGRSAKKVAAKTARKKAAKKG